MGGTRLGVVAAVLGGQLLAAALVWFRPDGSGPPDVAETTPPPADQPPAPPGAQAPAGTPDPDPSSAPQRPDGGVFVMWARGGLPVSTVAAARGLPGVEAVAFVRSDTLGLIASRDADGAAVDRLEEGFRVPVEVTAVEPQEYAAVVAADDPDAHLGELRPGTAVLSETGAELRGIGVGGSVDLVGLEGIRVVGIAPDGLLRNAELVLHAADAEAAGIGRDGSIVVRHRHPPGDRRDGLAELLASLAPDDVPARVVDGHRTRAYRAPLVLPLPEVKRRFGEFAFRPRPGVREVDISATFVDERIVSAQVPLLGEVRCHEAIIDDLRAALQEIVDAGLSASIDPAAYAGCFVPRRISEDRARLSRHSWGIAFDINVDLSLPGLGPPPPPEVVAIFGRHGFRWGGEFLQPDNHHFEWVGPAAGETQADLATPTSSRHSVVKGSASSRSAPIGPPHASQLP